MIYTHKLLFGILTVFHSLITLAQECNGTFTGRVLDESSHPVVGASVILSQQHQTGSITDDEGAFEFSGLCDGTYKVRVQYLGFETADFEITVTGNVSRIIHLREAVNQLKEVVVEDQLMHAEHAHNLSRLSIKQLSESAGKSLGESLKEITGVNSIQTGPGIFKPVIHGVHSQRVLILNHGIRQEGQQWGAEHAPEIDPFIASDIAVIKDASSIKYGTDAIGGVIIVNPAPLPETSEIGGYVSTVLQSNGRSGAISGMLEGGIQNRPGWGWRIQGTGKRTGDFHTATYNLTNTGIRELNFSAATGYHSEKAGFEVFFSHFASDIGILRGVSLGNQNDLQDAMERPVPLYTSSFSYDIDEPRQSVSHNLIKISGHLNLTNSELRLQYGFQNNRRKEYDFRIGDLSETPDLNLKLSTHSLETEWEYFKDGKWSLCTGITGIFQQNRKVFGTQRIPFIPDFNSISTGLFSVLKMNVSKWVIDLGVRYDYRYYSVAGYDYKNSLFRSSLNFGNLSATAGATMRWNSEQTLNLNLSTSWRPPHVAELYSVGTHQSAAANEYGFLLNDSTNEVLDIDDVSFKTEQAVKVVSTYQRRIGRISFEASPYANYIFNYIYLRPTGITQNIRGTYAYFRYSQTDALFLGLDLSATWHPRLYFTVVPRMSLLRASDVRNDDYLIFIPANRYEVALRYEKPTPRRISNFFVESKAKYVSRQNRAPTVVTVREINEAQQDGRDPFNGDKSNFDFMAPPPGYFLLNVSTGITIRTEKTQYELRLGSENLLNNSYREYTNRFRYYADDLGRNFVFSLKCIF
jgi:iron complex outermembrane receptor protein